jgi:hypothetical protein
MTFNQKSDGEFWSPRAVDIYTYCENTKIQVFWNMTLCLTVRIYRHFGRNICTNFSINTIPTLIGLFRLWLWREKFCSKTSVGIYQTVRCQKQHNLNPHNIRCENLVFLLAYYTNLTSFILRCHPVYQQIICDVTLRWKSRYIIPQLLGALWYETTCRKQLLYFICSDNIASRFAWKLLSNC